MELSEFPHNEIIEKKKIKMSDLDETLRTSITGFNKRHNAWKMKKGEDGLKLLLADSNLIAQHIYDYYVDKEDQTVEITPGQPLTNQEVKEIVKDIKAAENDPAPVAEPPKETPPVVDPKPVDTPPAPTPAPVVENTPTDKNEKVLHDLFTAGKTTVSRGDLVAAGFDKDPGAYGCKAGGYRLYKEFFEKNYRLSKI